MEGWLDTRWDDTWCTQIGLEVFLIETLLADLIVKELVDDLNGMMQKEEKE